MNGNNVEEKIWNYFKSKNLTDAGVAGLMGNLYAESGLKPTNLQGSYEKKLDYTDDGYTADVDSGAYNNFVRDSAGYGLAQWTYWSRKQALLAYATNSGKSIGDLEMQLNFLYKELSEGYKSVLSTLKTTSSVREASDSVLLKFERPADQSVAAQERRAGYGQTYYNKYVENKEDKDMAVEKDNTPAAWAKEAVEWAIKNGIMFGDDRGDYQLNKSCTRQEMLVFLDRLYKLVMKEV